MVTPTVRLVQSFPKGFWRKEPHLEPAARLTVDDYFQASANNHGRGQILGRLDLVDGAARRALAGLGIVVLACAAPPAATHDLTGQVFFSNREVSPGSGVFLTSGCASFGPSNAKITVEGDTGAVLGLGNLRNGGVGAGPNGLVGCLYDFAIADLPDATFYTFDGPIVGDAAGRTYALGDLITAGWDVEFTGR